jgi:hypothetical protein
MEPKMTKSIKRTVVSADFAQHGYSPEAELLIEPDAGRYVVTLWLNQPNAERLEVAWEPAEPDRQALGIEFATRDPIAAVLDAIKTDKWRREEEEQQSA